jgi:hypothetical protein
LTGCARHYQLLVQGFSVDEERAPVESCGFGYHLVPTPTPTARRLRGRSALGKYITSDHHVVAQGPEQERLLLDVDARRSPSAAEHGDDKHLVAGGRELSALQGDALQRITESVEPATDPAMASVGVGLRGERWWRRHLELGVSEGEHRFDAFVGQGRIGAAHDLHVLLRHRPPSIALGTAA